MSADGWAIEYRIQVTLNEKKVSFSLEEATSLHKQLGEAIVTLHEQINTLTELENGQAQSKNTAGS